MVRILSGRHVKRQGEQTRIPIPPAPLSAEDRALLDRAITNGRAKLEWQPGLSFPYNAIVEFYSASGGESSFCEVEASG